MAVSDLDNPVWSALQSRHRHLAVTHGDMAWYPAALAPFIAVASPDSRLDLESAHAQGLGAEAYFLGAVPGSLPAPWMYAARVEVLQLRPPPDVDSKESAGTVLDASHHASMYSLAAVAFPDFFRRRTAELGMYLGMFDAAGLIAMAGERLALGDFQEISGVCTHPDHAGHGHARRLTRALLQRHRARGVQSFLHVSALNTAARRLYESMGFTIRASLPMAKIERRAR